MKKALLAVQLALAACWPAAGWSQSIPDQIDAILARTALVGNTWTVLVENDSGSVIYYQRNPTTGQAPASNTKIFTTSAAFGLLGTNYAFPTRVYRDGTLSGGVLTGNLNLVCEHDMTWNTTVFSSARAPLDHIAAQLKALGLTTVTGNVQCYGLCAYGFGSTDNLAGTSTASDNASAAAAFLLALQAQGITVSGSAAGQTGFTAPGTLLYTHLSSDLTYGGKPLRLDIACIPLLKVSHNVMADRLCRHLGWKLGTRRLLFGRRHPGFALDQLSRDQHQRHGHERRLRPVARESLQRPPMRLACALHARSLPDLGRRPAHRLRGWHDQQPFLRHRRLGPGARQNRLPQHLHRLERLHR